MAVSTSPIPFQTIPRTSGATKADTPTVQGGQASMVDTDFGLINTWAATIPPLITTTVVTTTIGNVAANVTWDNCYNVLVADIRTVNWGFSYKGTALTAANTAANFGSLYLPLATITDARFIPKYVNLVGSTNNGMCVVEVNSGGAVYLTGLSFGGMVLPTNGYIHVTGTYILG